MADKYNSQGKFPYTLLLDFQRESVTDLGRISGRISRIFYSGYSKCHVYRETVMTEATTYHKNLKLMGNHFQISAVAEEEEWAHACIDAGILEIQRIEKLLTTFSEESETALINRNAGLNRFL